MSPKKPDSVCVRVATTDKVSFMVSMDGAKLTYKSLVDKIKEKYAETVNIYPRVSSSPGTPPSKVKAKDIDVIALRNYQGMHIDEKVSMDTICSMDPFPSSPTIGVVLKKDAEKSPAAASWQFRGTTLEFVTPGGDGDAHMADAASAHAAAKQSTPAADKIKKRKAEHITADSPAVVLSDAVKAKVDSIVAAGLCKREDLDDVALGRLAGVESDSKALEVLDKFSGPEIETCENKSRHLMKIIRETAGSASPVKAKAPAAEKPSKDEEPSKKAKTDTVRAPTRPTWPTRHTLMCACAHCSPSPSLFSPPPHHSSSLSLCGELEFQFATRSCSCVWCLHSYVCVCVPTCLAEPVLVQVGESVP
jgi:hypothetical protein